MKLDEWCNEKRGRMMHLARRMCVTKGYISLFVTHDRKIPPHRAVQIEKFTDGAVTRRDCRPDDWQDIWPELSK